jgi:hypothetical protein
VLPTEGWKAGLTCREETEVQRLVPGHSPLNDKTGIQVQSYLTVSLSLSFSCCASNEIGYQCSSKAFKDIKTLVFKKRIQMHFFRNSGEEYTPQDWKMNG